ncbi:DNA translocase FtsK [Magnetospirillum molischianum]|uniref:DNA translocase n=1 Tax=Magnetospirillum molischianum DSM 120 TaxID=1150626 RepID=H8FR20_MAGML|nr:DNA translocase FtsK [Magnetospirillum molischianum]CCG40808.1 DNA translocase [Magnetospirillum molischianum DSM 120]
MSPVKDDTMTAADFNFWCAVNSKPFRLMRHRWPDGSVEWDVEVFPGRPEATVAYGTGQTDETPAAAAAFAFAAGVEWGESFARPAGAETWDEDDSEEPGPVVPLPLSVRPTPAAPPPPIADSIEADDEPDVADEHDIDVDDDEDAPPRRQGYTQPSIQLLQPPPPRNRVEEDEESLAGNARTLETVLRNFKVRGEIMEVRQGPVVTLYEFEPLPGTKSSTVINLADDIARSMSTITTRIAIVPGRSVIGIEMPNPIRETVYLREILESPAFLQHSGRLPLALGKDIAGEPVVADLARMPHLLIAGTTGSGKSVGINAMILSLLYRFRPDECRLIMVDPKMLELSVYDGIPHLLTPVVTDPDKAVRVLKWAVREMEARYRAMALLAVRNIDGYNARLGELAVSGQKVTHRVQVGFDRASREPVFEEQPIDLKPLPHIVVLVDEMADLMMVAGRDLEVAIQRLAQMARAAGIHLIMATQRPSVDVITGTIKANFPTRISFQVTSRIDSRTILGESGAEQLVGQGDMLFMSGGGRVSRIHGPFVSDTEVEQVVAHLKAQGEPDYLGSITDDDDDDDLRGSGDEGGGIGSGDDLYDQAVALVTRERKVSISFIQRQLQIGYNRSARLVERMETEGVVSPSNHQGKREVLGRNGGN